MGRGRRNRSYAEILQDSGARRAKELHENKQARMAKKIEKLQAEMEQVHEDMESDKADFKASIPADLLPVETVETVEPVETVEETSEVETENVEVFEAVGSE